MALISASTELDGSASLWRYMSLDKFVDLLSTSELHFAPLASFMKSDPFEGYLPAVALEADAAIFRPHIKDSELAFQLVEEHRKNIGHEVTSEERALFERQLDDLKAAPQIYRTAIAKATCVNCWHMNKAESEAMWRLYGDGGKGIAVETTFDALKKSIQACESAFRVHIYPVKYLDFFDNSLTPADCVVEGQRAPFLKRVSYEHEHEIRASVLCVPETARKALDLESWKPAPVRLPIKLDQLIKAVHVSPYAAEPFPSSVSKICEKFCLPDGIVRPSRLLSGHEELLARAFVSD
jgi:hypothetical protein